MLGKQLLKKKTRNSCSKWSCSKRKLVQFAHMRQKRKKHHDIAPPFPLNFDDLVHDDLFVLSRIVLIFCFCFDVLLLFWCFAFVLMFCFWLDVLLLFWCFAFVLILFWFFCFCFDFSFILGQIVMFKDGLKNVYLSLAPSCGPLCHSVGERREHIECAWCELYRNYIFLSKRKFSWALFKILSMQISCCIRFASLPKCEVRKNCDGALFLALLFPPIQILLFSIKALTLQIQ